MVCKLACACLRCTTYCFSSMLNAARVAITTPPRGRLMTTTSSISPALANANALPFLPGYDFVSIPGVRHIKHQHRHAGMTNGVSAMLLEAETSSGCFRAF